MSSPTAFERLRSAQRNVEHARDELFLIIGLAPDVPIPEEHTSWIALAEGKLTEILSDLGRIMALLPYPIPPGRFLRRKLRLDNDSCPPVKYLTREEWDKRPR